MKTIALIPMRGGSQSIPQKNIKLIAGKPLCYWSINAAIESNIFNTIYISTDAEYIQTTVKNLFPTYIKSKKIILEIRPSSLALDTTSTEEVISHFIKDKSFDCFCLIQVTSPLLTAKDLIKGYQELSQHKDSVLSVVNIKRFLWNKEGFPINYDYLNRPRRQDFSGSFLENGAFYFSTRDSLLKNNNRLGGAIGLVEMDDTSFFEIDEPTDFEIVEVLLKRKSSINLNRSEIKAVVIDVDGTLTDGGMHYGKAGEVLKKFNTQDAKGIELTREKGIKVFILTAEDSPSVHARFQKVKVDFYSYGIKDKKAHILNWVKENNFNLKNILYIGDDLGDLEAMGLCEYRACPNNAVPEIQGLAQFCATKCGGNGAVREILDLL